MLCGASWMCPKSQRQPYRHAVCAWEAGPEAQSPIHGMGAAQATSCMGVTRLQEGPGGDHVELTSCCCPPLCVALLLSFLPHSPSWSLAGVVAVIVSGLLLLVRGEADFDTTGFVLVMSASCMSGLRFTLTQVLLHGNRGNANSSSSISSGQQEQGKPAADSHGECGSWTTWRVGGTHFTPQCRSHFRPC